MSESKSDQQLPPESPPTKQSQLPTPAEIRRSLVGNERARQEFETVFKRKFTLRSANSEEEFEHVKGVKDHYDHKKKWSWFLMFVVFLLVSFQIVLLWKVGSGAWDFEAYPYLIPALLVQNFAAVLGLARFVVRSLFSSITRKKADPEQNA